MKTIQIEINFNDFLKELNVEISKCLVEHLRRSDDNELLTRKQLRQKYGLSYSTIHRYMTRGILRPNRIGGKVFFDKKQIESSISQKVARKESIN